MQVLRSTLMSFNADTHVSWTASMNSLTALLHGELQVGRGTMGPFQAAIHHPPGVPADGPRTNVVAAADPGISASGRAFRPSPSSRATPVSLPARRTPPRPSSNTTHRAHGIGHPARYSSPASMHPSRCAPPPTPESLDPHWTLQPRWPHLVRQKLGARRRPQPWRLPPAVWLDLA